MLVQQIAQTTRVQPMLSHEEVQEEQTIALPFFRDFARLDAMLDRVQHNYSEQIATLAWRGVASGALTIVINSVAKSIAGRLRTL